MNEIKAEFVLDKNGGPKYIESNGRRHYKVSLSIPNVPAEAIGVTYRLDQTYLNPLRESSNPANDFKEDITSYGDFLISATIRTKTPLRISETLYNALARTHQAENNNEIQMALNDIKTN